MHTKHTERGPFASSRRKEIWLAKLASFLVLHPTWDFWAALVKVVTEQVLVLSFFKWMILSVLKLHRRLKGTASIFLSSARGREGGLSRAHWVTQNFITGVSLDTFAFVTITCSNSCFWSVPCPSSLLQLDMPFPASRSRSSRGTQPVQLHGATCLGRLHGWLNLLRLSSWKAYSFC